MLASAKLLKNVYALDLGTTKFCVAAVRAAPGATGTMVDTVSVPAEGMRRGMLANVEQAKVALAKLLEAAEKHFGDDVAKVIVGVAGSHLKSRTITVSVSLESGAVTAKDLIRLYVLAESQQQFSESRELLHTVPVGYRVDARDSVDDPIGFTGQTLSGDFFLIDADKAYLKDIVDVCNASGLQVVRLYSEPFASASVTIPDKYKEVGVVAADIGGGTTDGLVFKAGRPVHAFTVNVAGKLMTNDLAIGLNISPEDAEAVKIRFGIKPREGDSVEVKDLRGEPKVIGAQQVTPILLPRVHELGLMVAKELVPFRGALGAGLVLTGGGAGVQGITEYYQTRMGIPVSRAKPVLPRVNVQGETLELEMVQTSPHPTRLATAIGLLNLELCRTIEQEKTKRASWTSRYLGNFINWIKELS